MLPDKGIVFVQISDLRFLNAMCGNEAYIQFLHFIYSSTLFEYGCRHKLLKWHSNKGFKILYLPNLDVDKSLILWKGFLSSSSIFHSVAELSITSYELSVSSTRCISSTKFIEDDWCVNSYTDETTRRLIIHLWKYGLNKKSVHETHHPLQLAPWCLNLVVIV
jgi:hypothetical protein